MTGREAAHRPATPRVAHVVRSTAFAGVERYITYVAPELASRGFEVVVVGGDPDAMRAALPPNIAHLPAATTVAAVRGLLGSRPLDLVHAHMAAGEVAATVTSPSTGAPFVATRHFRARRGRSPLGRLAAPVVDRMVRQEVAISSFVADGIGRPAIVVPNGVPDRPLSSDRQPVVLMAQRLEAEKEVGVGIRAWAASGLAGDGWRLVVAGEGAQAADLRALAGQLGVAGSVDFIGRQPDLDRLLAESGIFLATARAEPFGLSVVEAMAHGLPVVASGAGGHLETVGACSTEWLFPPGDPRACAERLRRLASDSTALNRYGRALRAVQQREFSLDHHVERLVDIYRGVMAAEPPRRVRARQRDR